MGLCIVIKEIVFLSLVLISKVCVIHFLDVFT